MNERPVRPSLPEDEQPFGELHRLLERLYIGAALIDECIAEYESILAVSPRDRLDYFG